MPSAVPIRQDISAAELRQNARIEADGRASRRMLAIAAVLDGAGHRRVEARVLPENAGEEGRAGAWQAGDEVDWCGYEGISWQVNLLTRNVAPSFAQR